MTLLSHLFGGGPGRRRRPGRLALEALEDRTLPANVFVVPLTADVNATSFRTLSDAIKAAGPNGTVTIEPGAVADFNDAVTNNTFTSFSDTIISLSSDSGAVVQDNSITGGGAISVDQNGTSVTKAPQTGIAISGGVGVRVANNKIKLAGDGGTPGGTTG